jgi:GMP synthase-like glutamine amidotransferase
MILVIDMNWKKNSLGFFEFVLPIISISEKIDKSVSKHFSEIRKKDIDCAEKIVLSGTPLKDNVASAQPEKFDWLAKIDKPVLGICAGMETIGAVFGLPLLNCLEIGMTQITTRLGNNLFSGVFQAYSLHNFAVDPDDQFEVLAESEKCVQAIKHKERPTYGFLFHPEVRNEEILKRFLLSESEK